MLKKSPLKKSKQYDIDPEAIKVIKHSYWKAKENRSREINRREIK